VPTCRLKKVVATLNMKQSRIERVGSSTPSNMLSAISGKKNITIKNNKIWHMNVSAAESRCTFAAKCGVVLTKYGVSPSNPKMQKADISCEDASSIR
jgi:hypothetical protein